MNEVASYWCDHRGLNVLRLPRSASHAWSLQQLAAELDRVRIGVRSVEVSWLQGEVYPRRSCNASEDASVSPRRDGPADVGGSMFMRNGPALVDGDNAAALRVSLEDSANTATQELGAAAITRLIVTNRCPVQFCWQEASLAALQQLFPALRDVVSASDMIAPASSPVPLGGLRPFRVLHLMGGYDYATHDELLSALEASPSLVSLAVKEVDLHQDNVFRIPGKYSCTTSHKKHSLLVLLPPPQHTHTHTHSHTHA